LHSSSSLHLTTIAAIQEQSGHRKQERKMGLRGRGALALLLLLFVHGGGQQAAEAAGGGAFVRVQGTRFVHNGKPFFANGFNAYWLMTLGADPAQRGKVTSALSQAAGAGLSVARTWAFNDGGGSSGALQYSPGRYNENTFQVRTTVNDDSVS
jgi:mannan endo-1,4-beta-mannosidase